MKTIGIIGGMGPLATVDLFKKIVTLTDANSDNEHIHIIIDNNTEIPDRTNYILNRGESPENYLIKSAVKLEMMGSDLIIMPCNTAHYFYDSIIKYIKIPFLNMVEETAKEALIKYPGFKNIGLLATEGTCNACIYDSVFEEYGLKIIKPSEDMQQYVTKLIYDIKKGRLNIDFVDVGKVIAQLKARGAEMLILGCTELPVAFQMFNISENYIDPTEILACSAIRFVGKRIVEDVEKRVSIG